MAMLRRLVHGLAAVLGLGAVSPAAAQAAMTDHRGFLLEGAGGQPASFRPCGTGAPAGAPLRVEDRSPNRALAAGVAEIRRIMYAPERPIYVEFRGQAVGGTVTVQQLQRVVGHARTCEDAPRDVPAGARLWAEGVEPRWRFVATAQGAQLQVEGGAPVRFPPAPFAQPARTDEGERIYDAWSPQDGGSIRLVISDGVCHDGRSETATGARATARIGSRVLEGCAARF